MDFIEGSNLFCKAKSVVSSLHGIILWTSTLPSPMRFPKEWSIYPGLKTLVQHSQGSPDLTHHPCYVLHSYMIPPSSPSPTTAPPLVRSLTNSLSYSSCYSTLDDLIGAESGVCMNSNIEEEIAQMEKIEECHFQGKRKQRYAMRKKYPPPIPLLARTGNLPGHMPWILTRHYIDGKLVLVEERVKHHEYFEAYRENGRLVLNLVPLDDKVTYSHFTSKNEEEEIQDLDFLEEEKEAEKNPDQEFGEGEEGREAYLEMEPASNNVYVCNLENTEAVDDKGTTDKFVATSASLPKSCLESGIGRSGDLHKCFTYAGRMIISDINLSCNANAHRNACESIMNIHSGSASLDFGNYIHHAMTTVV